MNIRAIVATAMVSALAAPACPATRARRAATSAVTRSSTCDEEVCGSPGGRWLWSVLERPGVARTHHRNGASPG